MFFLEDRSTDTKVDPIEVLQETHEFNLSLIKENNELKDIIIESLNNEVYTLIEDGDSKSLLIGLKKFLNKIIELMKSAIIKIRDIMKTTLSKVRNVLDSREKYISKNMDTIRFGLGKLLPEQRRGYSFSKAVYEMRNLTKLSNEISVSDIGNGDKINEKVSEYKKFIEESMETGKRIASGKMSEITIGDIQKDVKNLRNIEKNINNNFKDLEKNAQELIAQAKNTISLANRAESDKSGKNHEELKKKISDNKLFIEKVQSLISSMRAHENYKLSLLIKSSNQSFSIAKKARNAAKNIASARVNEIKAGRNREYVNANKKRK